MILWKSIPVFKVDFHLVGLHKLMDHLITEQVLANVLLHCFWINSADDVVNVKKKFV